MSEAGSAVQQSRNVKDTVAGVVVAAAGAVLLNGALAFDGASSQAAGVGPRFFPVVASSVLLLGGLSLVITSLRSAAKPSTGEESAVPLPRLAMVIAIFIGFLLIFAPVGFLISTALFMTVMTTFVRPDRLKSNAIVGVLVSLCIYLSFTELLGVGLPVGILG